MPPPTPARWSTLGGVGSVPTHALRMVHVGDGKDGGVGVVVVSEEGVVHGVCREVMPGS